MNPNNPQNQGPRARQGLLRTLLFYALLLMMFYYATSSLRRNVEVEALMYSDIVDYFRNEQVEEFVVNNKNVINIKLNDTDHTELSFQLPSLELFEASVQYFPPGAIHRCMTSVWLYLGVVPTLA